MGVVNEYVVARVDSGMKKVSSRLMWVTDRRLLV